MRSMTGAEPATVPAAEIVAAWDAGLRALKAVHHQVGNYLVRVSGRSAEVFCYGTPWHYPPNPTGRDVRDFAGSYEFGLAKPGDAWKIERSKFNPKFADGNLDLERAAAGS